MSRGSRHLLVNPEAPIGRPTIRSVLTQRQELVLRKVVEDYLEAGTPVGSKALAENVRWGPSTIRNELASLEELGLLAHPHTSAGRIPTEAGYRYFVDRLLPREDGGPRLSLSLVRREVDDAMRVTTETLSQVTNLLAIVTAPPIDTSTVRHIEVLVLQPQVLMVVVITSTGGVTKRLFTFPRPVDPGLADRAASDLDERLGGPGRGGGGAGRPRAGGADAALPPARPVALEHRGRLPRRALAGVHRPRGKLARHAVRRGHGPAASPRAVRRRVRAERADGHARAAGDHAR